MNRKDWLTQVKNARKTCIQEGNLKKVHYLFEDTTEMVEEYNLETECLTRRAWKIKNELKGEGNWVVEIGDPEPSMTKEENTFISESAGAPIVNRRLTKRNLEWRIRNLPYSIETYTVTADKNENCLIVRTTNKKYYKKLNIPDLERAHLLPEQNNVALTHKFNTLIITYKKPTELLDLEKAVWNEVKDLKPRRDGNMDCNPS